MTFRLGRNIQHLSTLYKQTERFIATALDYEKSFALLGRMGIVERLLPLSVSSDRGWLHSTLKEPQFYHLFQKAVTRKSISSFVLSDVFEGDTRELRVLDIGCGPGSLLLGNRGSLNPNLYCGIDPSEAYISQARRYFPMADFHVGTVGTVSLAREDFDLVYIGGVLHHVTDEESVQILEYSKTRLRSGGKIISIDPTKIEKQNPIALALVQMDRGRYVRSIEGMSELWNQCGPFSDFSLSHHQGFLRLPYDHVVCVGEVI